jgi:uncharacterized protein (DUF1330 family)
VVCYHSASDAQKFAAYVKLASAAVAPFGARFLTRNTASAACEVGLRERTVIAEYPNLEKAIAARESAAYGEALKALGDGVVRDFWIVEGLEVKIDAARSGVNMPTASVLSIIARDTLLPVTSRSKKGVATVRTDALALVEARFVGREKHIRWYNVVHLAQAALGD